LQGILVFSLPLAGFYLLWSTYKQKHNAGTLVAVAGGFSAVLVVEALTYYVDVSDPLYRLRRSSDTINCPMPRFGSGTRQRHGPDFWADSFVTDQKQYS